jgi:xanthosine utilization system XapX-like protein
MAVMYSLVYVRPMNARIALVGVFGLVFAVSAKIFTGRISRGEIFAYTAAFFAISSVFVGTTSGGVVGGL